MPKSVCTDFGTRSIVLIMVFLALKTFNLVPKFIKTFDLVPKIIKTFNLVPKKFWSSSKINKTFDLVKKETFDLVKFDLPTPSLGNLLWICREIKTISWKLLLVWFYFSLLFLYFRSFWLPTSFNKFYAIKTNWFNP